MMCIPTLEAHPNGPTRTLIAHVESIRNKIHDVVQLIILGNIIQWLKLRISTHLLLKVNVHAPSTIGVK